MSWGQAFSNAYNSASAKAQQAASVVATSVGSAVDATVEGAKVAGRVGAFATRAAVETAEAGARGVVKLADKAAASAPLVGGYYQQAKQALSPTQPPRARVTEPCPNSIEGKIARLEQRNALIAKGQAADSTPDQKAAAERLARDNQAVELARLSGDAYAQYESPRENHPPLGWTALSDTDLGIAGIDPNLVHEAKAVVYQTPPNWPGGQQTVLAFRGTNQKDPEDLKTDADQALGKETVQYKAAAQLGTVMSQNFGSDVIVTGHSLGGGKAQAAGISGGLTGMMFNSAGLHPNSVGGDVDAASQFTQFRAPADPLTGLQNSAALQTGAGALAGGVAMPFSAGMLAGDYINKTLGFPPLPTEARAAAERGATAFPAAMGNLAKYGYMLPPAIGPVVEVPSLDDNGQPVPVADLGGQHSWSNLVNGFEREKSEDVATLQT